jgi:hypothetical protein
MKTLNIILTVKAINTNTAEQIGKRELMEFAKTLGLRSGSFMASCEGDTTYKEYDLYEVDARVQIDGSFDVTETIKEMQRKRSDKAEIFSSMIFVSDTKPEEKHEPKPEVVACDECGQIVVKGYETVVNKGTDAEYTLCAECLDRLWEEGDITSCMCCENWIDNDELIENPVMHEKNICPVCGRIYNE